MVWVVAVGRAMGTVSGDRTGGCSREQRRGVAIGNASIAALLGATAVNAVGVVVVEAGQVRVAMFVFVLVEQRLAREGLFPKGLPPVIPHCCGLLVREMGVSVDVNVDVVRFQVGSSSFE